MERIAPVAADGIAAALQECARLRFRHEPEPLPKLLAAMVERVSPGTAIVRSPADLFRQFEEAEGVPIKVRHPDGRLGTVPPGSTSLFQAKGAIEDRPKRERRAALKRSVRFTLRFPDAGLFDSFLKASLEMNHVLSIDAKGLSVTYSRKEEGIVQEVLKALQARYDFTVQDEGP